MEVTDQDIRERIELDAEGVLRWRSVEAAEGDRWAQRYAKRINAKAGKPVPTGKSGCVRLYDALVPIGRVRAVLMGRAYAPRAKKSGLPLGVTINRGRYVARIKRSGKLHWVGSYETPEQAADARRAAIKGRS